MQFRTYIWHVQYTYVSRTHVYGVSAIYTPAHGAFAFHTLTKTSKYVFLVQYTRNQHQVTGTFCKGVYGQTYAHYCVCACYVRTVHRFFCEGSSCVASPRRNRTVSQHVVQPSRSQKKLVLTLILPQVAQNIRRTTRNHSEKSALISSWQGACGESSMYEPVKNAFLVWLLVCVRAQAIPHREVISRNDDRYGKRKIDISSKEPHSPLAVFLFFQHGQRAAILQKYVKVSDLCFGFFLNTPSFFFFHLCSLSCWLYTQS